MKKYKQQKVKVLIISTVGLIYDGITSVILECLRAMNREGIEFYVVSTIDCRPGIKKQLEDLGCIIVEFANRRTYPIQYFNELTKFIRKNDIDIVHAHGNSATLAVEMIAAWLGGAKKRIAHSHNTRCDQVKADKVLRPFFNLFYTDALACGEDAGKWLFGTKQFMVLNNGRDVEKFSYNPEKRQLMREQLGLTKELAIGHVGGFVEQKNHSFLINIFKEIVKLDSNVKFFLIGDGPKRTEIEEEAKGLDVAFLGTVDNVYDYLNAMDGMILPSLFEGLPLVAIEWQLNGLPVLAADTITKECVISENFELLSLDEQAEKWAKKIVQMVHSNNREKNSLCAQNNAQNYGFDINESAKILRDIYLHS